MAWTFSPPVIFDEVVSMRWVVSCGVGPSWLTRCQKTNGVCFNRSGLRFQSPTLSWWFFFFKGNGKRIELLWICELLYIRIYDSGQIISTSHDLTPNGGLVREFPLFQGNLGWWNIIIWPDSLYCWYHRTLLRKRRFQHGSGAKRICC